MLSKVAALAALCLSFALMAPGAALAQTSFIDQVGRTVTLDAPPKKLIALPSAASLVYYAVDGTADHLAGAPSTFKKTLQSGLYDQTIPELTTIDTNMAGDGFVPNVEAILAAKPDLVYSVTHKEGLIQQLEDVGLKVVGWNCCTEEQRRGYITMSGYISGRNDRAQMILGLQDESNAALRQHFAGVDKAKFVPILEVDKIGEQIQVVANSSQDYGLSGANNLASDDSGEWWRQIDAEQFLVWNPKIIIIPQWASDLTPEDFYNDPVLASVDAVKNHQVYKVPKFNRSPDAPEVHLTAQWLARLTHPADFAGQPAFRDTVKSAFQSIYGKTLTDEQTDAILEMQANNPSADYRKILG